MNKCEKAKKEYEDKLDELWDKTRRKDNLMDDIIKANKEWNDELDKIQREIEEKYEVKIEHEEGYIRVFSQDCDTEED